MDAPHLLASTPRGHVDPVEAATIALYGCEAAMEHRETARIQVDGAEVHLDVYPAAEGVQRRGAVVFIPGLSNHALGYADFEWKLSRRGFDVVALDIRGHGRSSGPRGDFTLPELIEDVRGAQRYARARFGGPVAVMGTSLGGYYALVVANALDGFDCAVSHWIYLPDQPSTRHDARMKPIALLLNRIAPKLKLPTKGLADWEAVTGDDALREACFADPLMVWRYTVRALAGGMTWDPDPPLHELQVPHLVLLGAEDRMTPAGYTRGIFEQLRGEKEWVAIPGAGHMGGLVEHQDEVLDVVEDFLARRLQREQPVVEPDRV
jgi:alpha-beta hydrolase superfamily lysophospholipase